MASVGGVSFFTSLITLSYFGILNTFFLFKLIDSYALINLGWFVAGCLLGLWICDLLIKDHANVFIHELKHSIISNLVGNKDRGMIINKKTGLFKFAYYKHTKKFNALINLAPYFFPLATIPGLIIVAILYNKLMFATAIFVLGTLYGFDMLANIRDIGPHQTDFTRIRGGYWVGMYFVFVMNLTILTLILAWVFQKNLGIKIIFAEHYYLIERLIF